MEGTFICLYDEITGKSGVFNMLQVITVDFNERTLLFSNNGVVKTNEEGIEDVFRWMSGTKVKYSQIKEWFSNDEQEAQ